MHEHLFLDTHDAAASSMAAARRLGLEVDEYLWPLSDCELQRTRDAVAATIRGIDRLVLHGPIITSDLDVLAALDPQELRRIYEQAYASACFHKIDRLVFHSGFVPGKEPADEWLARVACFWRSFLADKPKQLAVYIENMVDDDPSVLARLCDMVADSRLRLCLDVGHAHCNSPIPVSAWIEQLGARIGHVHLHNNDGHADRHWPLNKGTLDIYTVLQRLQKEAPDTTYTLECDFESSLKWLLEHHLLPARWMGEMSSPN